MDIHCWVVLEDGKIIDPDFAQYELIKKIRNLEGNKLYKQLQDIEMTKKYEEMMKLATSIFMISPRDKTEFNKCFFNAIINKKKFGGRIVFGSMGWKIKNSYDIFWEYG